MLSLFPESDYREQCSAGTRCRRWWWTTPSRSVTWSPSGLASEGSRLPIIQHYLLTQMLPGMSPSWCHASWQLRTVSTCPKRSAQGPRSTQDGSGSRQFKSGVTRSRTKGSWFRNLLCLHWSVKMTLTALQATPVSRRRASVAQDQEK